MCLRYGFIAVVFLRPDYSTVYALLILSGGRFLFIHQKLSLIVVHFYSFICHCHSPLYPPHTASLFFFR